VIILKTVSFFQHPSLILFVSLRCPVCRALIPDWDGKGGGVIGLKARAIYSL